MACPHCDDEYLEGLASATRLIRARLEDIRETGEAHSAKVELKMLLKLLKVLRVRVCDG